jgi:hypothetical protein
MKNRPVFLRWGLVAGLVLLGLAAAVGPIPPTGKPAGADQQGWYLVAALHNQNLAGLAHTTAPPTKERGRSWLTKASQDLEEGTYRTLKLVKKLKRKFLGREVWLASYSWVGALPKLGQTGTLRFVWVLARPSLHVLNCVWLI